MLRDPQISSDSGLRILPIPDHQPPLEPQLPTAMNSTWGQPLVTAPAHIQGILPFESAPARDQRPILALNPTPDRPCPEQWARAFLRLHQQVIAGYRPISQLLNWVSPRVGNGLRAQVVPPTALTPRQRPPRITSLHQCEPSPRVVEVAAVLTNGSQVWAIAFRMVFFRQRWLITALGSI